ncbi:MAG: ABC transporter permease [Bacillota bacterium]
MRRLRILLIMLLVWEVGVRLSGTPALILPTPSAVAQQLFALVRSGELFPFIRNTMGVLLTGLGLGILAACVLTALAILTSWGRDLQGLLVSMFNPLPAIALLPLALLWFGLGNKSLLFVIVHSVVWSLSLNAYTGFATIPETMIRVGHNLGLTGWRLVKSIYIPAALPHILTGLKLAWAYSWRTIIAAELVFGVTGADGGLGWFIYKMRYSLETTAVFAGLVTIILIGLLIDLGFRRLENATVKRWGMSV